MQSLEERLSSGYRGIPTVRLQCRGPAAPTTPSNERPCVSMHRVVCGAGARRDDPARRKLCGEPAARAGRALDLEGGLVPREGVLDDGEAQAGTPCFARAAAIHAVKALGETGNVLGIDTNAGVFH